MCGIVLTVYESCRSLFVRWCTIYKISRQEFQTVFNNPFTKCQNMSVNRRRLFSSVRYSKFYVYHKRKCKAIDFSMYVSGFNFQLKYLYFMCIFNYIC
jgi:hypothetical protein